MTLSPKRVDDCHQWITDLSEELVNNIMLSGVLGARGGCSALSCRYEIPVSRQYQIVWTAWPVNEMLCSHRSQKKTNHSKLIITKRVDHGIKLLD